MTDAIRPLTVADIPPMVALFEEVGHEAGWIPRIEFSPEHIAGSLAAMITRDNCLSIGVDADDGLVCGFLIAELASPWYTPTPIAAERVFYVHPQYRRSGYAHQLIQRYIDWGRERGAAEILIGNGLGIQADKVKALCESLGFDAIGYILKQV